MLWISRNLNILQSKIAKQLLEKKVNNIESLNPDFISTGNIGCITQISHGTKVPILHTCLLYTSPSPRDISGSRMPSSA